jgi:hypothetical protein
LSEFDFRFNARYISDDELTVKAIKGFSGKKLCIGTQAKRIAKRNTCVINARVATCQSSNLLTPQTCQLWQDNRSVVTQIKAVRGSK